MAIEGHDASLDCTDIREICRQWLADLGYSGLVNANAFCGCGLDDLMPCDEPSPACQCAYEGRGDGEIWTEDETVYYASKEDADASGGPLPMEEGR